MRDNKTSGKTKVMLAYVYKSTENVVLISYKKLITEPQNYCSQKCSKNILLKFLKFAKVFVLTFKKTSHIAF